MLLTKIGIPREFCAIDASTLSMAYAYYTDGNLVGYGKILFSGSNIHEKIRDCAIKTHEFFQEHPTHTIAIEQTVFINSPKTLADLSRCQGALLAAAALAGVSDTRTVPPVTWQNYIGNGKLTAAEKQAIKSAHPDKSVSWYKGEERKFRKQRTIDFVNSKYSIELEDDDIADAIAIGHYSLTNWSKMNV